MSIVCIPASAQCQTQFIPNLPHEPMELTIGSGKVVVDVTPAKVSQGGHLTVRTQVQFSRRAGNVYNPFLQEEFKLPARIVVSSADGSKQFDLLNHTLPKRHVPANEPWVSPPLGIGREFQIQIAPRRPRDAANRTLDLEPGEYFIQAFYNNWLNAMWTNAPDYIGPRPAGQNLDAPQPYAGFTPAKMDEPIGISAPVKFTVVSSIEGPDAIAHAPSSPIRAILNVHETKTVVGRRSYFALTLTVEDKNPLNLFLRGILPGTSRFSQSLILSVYSDEGTYLGEVWQIDVGSPGVLTASDWLTMPPGGIITTEFPFLAGRVRGKGPSIVELPPGKYLVEACLYRHLITARPKGLDDIVLPMVRSSDRSEMKQKSTDEQMTYEEWEQSFPGPEVCRSNRVELEILPRTGD